MGFENMSYKQLCELEEKLATLYNKGPENFAQVVISKNANIKEISEALNEINFKLGAFTDLPIFIQNIQVAKKQTPEYQLEYLELRQRQREEKRKKRQSQ